MSASIRSRITAFPHYVTDPFGNHLELVAHGCDDERHPYR
jgi:hypothetical protein